MTTSASAASSSARRAVTVGFEVEHDAALVGAEAGEQSGVGPHGIAAGRLDLEDIRAQLGQQLGGVGARPPDGQIEDPDAVEESRVHGGSLS